MRNRFPGTCYRCNTWCAAGDGHFERFRGGFRVQHASCAIECRGLPDAQRQQWQHAKDTVMAGKTGKQAQRARRRLRDRAQEAQQDV